MSKQNHQDITTQLNNT